MNHLLRKLSIAIGVLLLGACTDLDEKVLPDDAGTQIVFETFELNAARNFVLVKLVNNSPYTLTSCRFEVTIYPQNPQAQTELQLSEVQADTFKPGEQAERLSRSFFIRQDLGPGYSTEVYFEWNMKSLHGPAVFTQEITELKGRTSP